MVLFEKDADCAAFERVLQEAVDRLNPRLLGYCLMPNHWYLVLPPPGPTATSRSSCAG